MQYKVEEKGPLGRVIQVTVPAEEVDAAIRAVAVKYGNSGNIPGFRKGKAPLNLVEKQFGRDIFPEATGNLIDGQVRGIIAELKVEPASSLDYDAQNVEKGKDFSFSFSFDAMPEFTLPNYEGFAVEQEEALVDEADVDAVVERARQDFAEPVLVEKKRKPKDGDIVGLDFTFYDETGEKELPGLKAENTQLPVGANQAMPEFEDIIKSIASGEAGEGAVNFPADFPNPELAGKKTIVKIKIHALYERKLPELDAEFAKRVGNFDSVEAMRGIVRESFLQSKKEQAEGIAKKTMIEALLKMTDFPLPPSLLERYVNASVADTLAALQKNGKSLESLGKSVKDLHIDARKEAEDYVRTYIFLYRVAQAENVTVEENDLIAELRRVAAAQRRSFEEVRDEYIKNEMLGALHERIMTDKAVQGIYDKAKLTFVKPKKAAAKAAAKPGKKAEAGADVKKAAAKKEAKPAAAPKSKAATEKKPKAAPKK